MNKIKIQKKGGVTITFSKGIFLFSVIGFLLAFIIVGIAPHEASADGSLVWATTTNPGPGEDVAHVVTMDSTGVYIAGPESWFGSIYWRIEKRNFDGSLAWFKNSDDLLGGYPDRPLGIVVDSTGVYVIGSDRSLQTTNYIDSDDCRSGNNGRWRIEKRDLATGDLLTGFDGDGILTINPSSNDDVPYAAAVDATGLYVVGCDDANADGGRWSMMKRDKTTGAPIWEKNYNVAGSGYENARGVAVDATGVYVVGSDYASVSDWRWRVEKRNLNTGDPIIGFGSGGALTFNSSGDWNNIPFDIAIDNSGFYINGYNDASVQWRIEKRNLTDGGLLWTTTTTLSTVFNVRKSYGIAVDSTGVYIAGFDTSLGGGNAQWHIENRDTSTGALLSSFDTDGVLVNNPSGGMDVAYDIVLGSAELYLVGYDYIPGNAEWRIEKRNKAVGGVPPTVSLTANPATIASGGSSRLTWTSSADATSCAAVSPAGWTAQTATNSFEDVLNITATTTYTIECTSPGGTAQQSATVTVSATAPTVNLSANPATIASGGSSTLTWTSTDATSCAAVSPAGWTAKTTINDSQLVTGIPATTTYTIECTGPGGTAQQSATVTVSGGGGGACGMTIETGTGPQVITCEPSGPPASQLRVYKNSEWRGLELVPTTDPNASKLRIQTPSGVKALRKQ